MHECFLQFLFQLSNKLGATYNPFVPLLPKVIQPDTTYSETRNLFTIRDLIKSTVFHYVTYQGSLTSPMCYEGVTWIVSTNKLFISSKELQEFRKIKDEHGNQLLENDRPLQKLNGRALLSHQKDQGSDRVSDYFGVILDFGSKDYFCRFGALQLFPATKKAKKNHFFFQKQTETFSDPLNVIHRNP